MRLSLRPIHRRKRDIPRFKRVISFKNRECDVCGGYIRVGEEAIHETRIIESRKEETPTKILNLYYHIACKNDCMDI